MNAFGNHDKTIQRTGHDVQPLPSQKNKNKKTTCAYIHHACEVVTLLLTHSVILQAILKLTEVNICSCLIVFNDYRLLRMCVWTCICAHASIFKILKSDHKVSQDYKVPLLPQTITFVLLMCMQVKKKNACQCGTPFIHILHESSLTSVFLPCIAECSHQIVSGSFP